MRDGVSHEGVLFWSPEFRGLGKGQKVEIRFMPHDLRSIEVYFDGVWLCTAEPHDKATDEERRRFLAANQEERKRAGERMARLSRVQRARIAPLHKNSEIEVVSPVTKEAISKLDRPDRSLQRNARFGLIIGGEDLVGGDDPPKEAA